MKTYRVIQDCHFANRYWSKDEIAEFPKDLFAPSNVFEEIKGPAAPNVVPVPVVMSMSEINEANKVNAPKTGMAYVPPEADTENKPKFNPIPAAQFMKEQVEKRDAYEQKFGRKKPGPKPKGQ